MRVGLSAAGAMLALSLGLSGVPGEAFAQASPPPATPPAEGAAKDDAAKGQKKPANTVDQITGKRLNDALEALKAEKYADVRAGLAKLNAAKLSPYEVSRVEQILAAADQGEEKFDAARGHLKKALDSGGLNDSEMLAVRFQIAQSFLAEERWKEGIVALKEWFAVAPNPNSSAYYLLAVAHYQLNETNAALEPAQKAVDLSDKPQESWLQLLLSLRVTREEYRLAVPILKRLIAMAPTKKTYWVQLSSVHAQLGSYQDAVLPMQAAYLGGLLTEEKEVKRLAELLVQVGIPFRAAQVLTAAMEKNQFASDPKAYELLGNCWIAAREYAKAVPPLEKAADLAENGDLFVRLAEVHMQREDWDSAAKALGRGIDKGKLKNPSTAQLLLGIAFYNQKRPKEARSAFERARADASSRSQADGWLRQIEVDTASRS
jgi:hypothetical protein